MVVKMIKWSPWPPASTAVFKKFQVKIKEIKLDGFFDKEDDGGEEREKVMVVEVKWKGGGKPGLVPFHRPSSSSNRRKNISGETVVKKGEIVKWYDEFENVCSFPIISKDNKIGPWDVSFSFLYGAKTKLEVIGKVSLNLAEMASKMEAVVQTKLPVKFNTTGVAREATLLVSLCFVEDRNSQDSARTIQSSSAQSKNVERTTGYGSIEDNEDSDKSAMVNLEGESVDCVDANSLTESAILGQTHQLDSVKKPPGIFSWKRRKLSFKHGKKNSNGDHVDEEENKIDIDRPQMASSSTHSIESKSRPKLDANEPSNVPGEQGSSTADHWEEKELVSRDGQAKLKASVFLASFDQRSDEAAGESACTALVAVIAYWLQSNLNDMPTRSEFDRLIIEGSTEWRKLCDNEDLMNHFSDKHFDLETVMRAGVRPISVLHENTFIGFFGAETFKSLKGAMSFDQIWDKITNGIEGNTPRIYIVSWNDHFFVLKIDANAYYIIDTLGERLFEGCNQAYILRFDDSALMYSKTEKEKVSLKEMSGAEQTKPEEASEEEIICSGRECCREFIKRFLASIPLKELQAQEEKEPVSYFALHQRLQIEFNFTSTLSSLSSSSSLTSSTYSLFSNDSVDC